MSFNMIKTAAPTTLSAAAAAAGTPYNVVLTNNSTQVWDFFMYQQDPGGPQPGVFSLAWFSKPAHPATNVQFMWTIDYNFVWCETGQLKGGVTFLAGQTLPADPVSANYVTFSNQDKAFLFGPVTSGGTAGSLTISEDASIPALSASVGIGMSGFGTFCVQAQPRISAIFTPTPEYWISFGSSVQQGVVLETQVGSSAQITFPPNVYTMYATLKADNTWAISQTPPTA